MQMKKHAYKSLFSNSHSVLPMILSVKHQNAVLPLLSKCFGAWQFYFKVVRDIGGHINGVDFLIELCEICFLSHFVPNWCISSDAWSAQHSGGTITILKFNGV